MTELTYADVKRRQTRVRVSILIVLTLLTIGQVKAFKQEQSLANSDNTLTISGPWEFTSLEPSKQGYIFTRMQIIETLLNIDEHGQLLPGLAQAWQVLEQGRIWQFKLRSDVIFHDGQLLNAAAVTKSLTIALQSHGVLRQAPIESIKALDDLTVQVQLTQAYAPLGAMLANYSTAILSQSAYNDEGQVVHLYGTGPYRLMSFEPPHKLLVSRFDEYWGEQGSILFASYLTGHRAESRILQAKSGEADIVFTLDPGMTSHLKKDDGVTVHTFDTPRTLILKLNSSHPFLTFKARQALSLAIDRMAISEHVMHGAGEATNQLLPASMQAWHLSN
ncbi:MAG: ABC transporter substrate-binding protein, partial [Vibrio sp.]